jgi:tetratricopeptide (TPR) repeat protein
MIENSDKDAVISGCGPILDSLKNTDPDQCPAPELLAGYHARELSGKMKRRIENHIALCPLCVRALEAMQAAEDTGTAPEGLAGNWQAMENALNRKFHERMKIVSAGWTDPAGRKTVRRPERNIQQALAEMLFQPKKLVYAGALASMAAAVLYSYAFFSRADSFSLSRIQPERMTLLRAGSPDTGLGEGLRQYGMGEYGSAVHSLENFVRENEGHYEANYYLGISRLADAEVSLLGLPYRFDRSRVEKAVSDLEKALSLAGNNSYYTADCCWYMGKARLMLNEPAAAREWFDRIIRLDAPYPERKENARRMVARLDRAADALKNPR